MWRKYGIICKATANLLLVVGINAIATHPAYAERTSFSCGKHEKYPATIALTTRGKLTVIVWTTAVSNGMTPKQRCNDASQRFQTAYENGNINYLTTGVIGDNHVICSAREEDGDCVEVLFTVNPSSDPNKVLQDLLRIRAYKGGPVYQNGNGPIYVNLEEYLNTLQPE
jgi:hypothetical protein